MATLFRIYKEESHGQPQSYKTTLATQEEVNKFIRVFGDQFVSKPIKSEDFSPILDRKLNGYNFYSTHVQDDGLNVRELADPRIIFSKLEDPTCFWAKSLLEATELAIQQRNKDLMEKT